MTKARLLGLLCILRELVITPHSIPLLFKNSNIIVFTSGETNSFVFDIIRYLEDGQGGNARVLKTRGSNP